MAHIITTPISMREIELADKIVEHCISTDPTTRRCMKDAKAYRSYLWDHRKISSHGSIAGISPSGQTMHKARIPKKVVMGFLMAFGPKWYDNDFRGFLMDRYKKAFGTGGSGVN